MVWQFSSSLIPDNFIDNRKDLLFFMKKKYVLFDLDGTLTDSQDGILNAIEYALDYYGIEVKDRNTLRPFLGPPLADSMQKYCGLDPDKAFEAVVKFREYYNTKGLFENRLYPGIERLLQTLQEKGCRLFVATSKPEQTAQEILAHFKLDGYFDYIGGATPDESRVKKEDVVRYVLKTAGILDGREAVMVGDRKHDVIGARRNGLESVGVLYGYGDRQELMEAGADYLAETVEEVAYFL